MAFLAIIKKKSNKRLQRNWFWMKSGSEEALQLILPCHESGRPWSGWKTHARVKYWFTGSYVSDIWQKSAGENHNHFHFWQLGGLFHSLQLFVSKPSLTPWWIWRKLVMMSPFVHFFLPFLPNLSCSWLKFTMLLPFGNRKRKGLQIYLCNFSDHIDVILN